MKTAHREPSSDPYIARRRDMVERQLRARGIDDPRVLAAMGEIPRHAFVPKHLQTDAYADHPLPIGGDQTISQPYIVAVMTTALDLRPTDRVLEIGTGSGYQTAILAALARAVFSVERSALLSRSAQERLADLGCDNVRFVLGDGTLGLPESGPFDRILAAGSLPEVPQGLLDQLVENGVLVAPVGGRSVQRLLRIERTGEVFERRDLGACCFVPLIGKAGWRA